MELLSLLAYIRLKKDLFSTSIFHRRTFYLRGTTEVVLPSFHINKASAAKNSAVPALFQGICDLSSPFLVLHSVGRLTSGRFFQVSLGTREFLRPQGAVFTLFGGLGLLPGT